MPKLILRCNYLKNAPPSHLANYMNYISTREGVEKIDNTCGLLPVTVKQIWIRLCCAWTMIRQA